MLGTILSQKQKTDHLLLFFIFKPLEAFLYFIVEQHLINSWEKTPRCENPVEVLV
ncbi:MAG: hypothetical protein JWM14_18 [Chitinophagaceae bacterium]|nr:hypothetical protein [Chitinophagaceae bacterium]